MSASTPLHSAHHAEMVEMVKLDSGFRVTTSSTGMAEVAEINPLHLTEYGIESQGLYTAVSSAAVAAEAEALSCDTAGNAAATSTFAVLLNISPSWTRKPTAPH